MISSFCGPADAAADQLVQEGLPLPTANDKKSRDRSNCSRRETVARSMDMTPPSTPPFSRTPAPHSSPAPCAADLLNINHLNWTHCSVPERLQPWHWDHFSLFSVSLYPHPISLKKSAAQQPDRSKVHDWSEALSTVGAQSPDLAAGCFCSTSCCTDGESMMHLPAGAPASHLCASEIA